MIKEVKATFECDRCGTEFTVKIDTAIEPPAGWSVFEIAEDAIWSLLNYEDATIKKGDTILGGSVDSGKHYCQRCTYKRNAT